MEEWDSDPQLKKGQEHTLFSLKRQSFIFTISSMPVARASVFPKGNNSTSKHRPFCCFCRVKARYGFNCLLSFQSRQQIIFLFAKNRINETRGRMFCPKFFLLNFDTLEVREVNFGSTTCHGKVTILCKVIDIVDRAVKIHAGPRRNCLMNKKNRASKNSFLYENYFSLSTLFFKPHFPRDTVL
jgi:hypothetical protein